MVLDSYDAFISHRSTSKVQARRVKAALERFAQPKKGDEPFRVYLDESSLRVGDLTTEIETGLQRSRALIVLIARDTVGSRWVELEVRYWLSHGGSPDRLFMVRVDDIDLSWNETSADWAHPDLVPSALHGLFSREQKYIDLASAAKGAERTALAPVFAAVRERPIESLLLEEADRARRRQRTIMVVAATMSVLFLLALAAGVWALISRNQAEAATREALGQANAAQAILASQTDPVQAAQYALRASEYSESLPVRAAMLAVAGSSANLIHSFDVPEGSSADSAIFTPDGSIVGTITRSSTDRDETQLELREVETAEVIASTSLPHQIAWVRLLSDAVGVLCSYQTGTHLIQVDDGTVSFTDLDAQPDAGGLPDGTQGMPETYSSCAEPVPVRDGLLVSTINGNATTGKQRLDLVRASGYATTLATFDSPSWSLSFVTVATGAGHVLVLDPTGAQIIDTAAGTITPISGAAVPTDIDITDSDYKGEFFGKTDDHEWLLVRRDDSGFTATSVSLDNTVWGAAPLVDADGLFTGQVVALDHGSVISLPGSGKEYTLGDDRSRNTGASSRQWNQYLPTLRRLDDAKYIAVFGSSVFVVDLNPSYPLEQGWGRAAVGDESSDTSRTDDWAVVNVGVSLQSASSQGMNPIAATCGSDVLLQASPTGFEEPAYANGGKLLVRANGTYRLVPDSTTFSAGCAVLESTPAVAILSTDPADDQVLLPGVSANARVHVSEQGEVAVLRGETPVAIFRSYSQSPAWSMEHHINYTSLNPHTIGSSGDNTIRQTEGGFDFTQADSSAAEISFDNPDGWQAVSPDATQLVALDAASEPQLVTADGVRGLVACAAKDDSTWQEFAWIPADGYAESASSARGAVLVSKQYDGAGDEPTTVVDCVTGEERTESTFADQRLQLERYEVRADGGVIETIARPQDDDDPTIVTQITWTGDKQPDTRTLSTSDALNSAVWSQDGRFIVTDNGATKTVQEWADGQWQPRTALASAGTAQFSPDDLLVLTNFTSTQSALSIVDPSTGHVILSDDLGDTDYLRNSGLPIRVSDGNMVLQLWEKSDTAGSALTDAPLTIPVDVDRLRGILCEVNRIAICDGMATGGSSDAPRPSTTPNAMETAPPPSASGDAALPAGWPDELAGDWCPASDPGSCFSVASLLDEWPNTQLRYTDPSTAVDGTTDMTICLDLDLEDSCTTSMSMYLRYFPVGVEWDCTALEVEEHGWPDCYPDYTSSHDSSKPRLVVLPNHQHSTDYVDTEPMYRATD